MKLLARAQWAFVGMTILAAVPGHAASFAEVRDVIFDRATHASNAKEQEEIDVYRSGRLPHYEVNSKDFVESGINKLLERAKSTTTETADFYPRLKKLLHPNGICFTGDWVIDEASPYTGYFAQGKHGLFVGRASVAMTETESGHKRGFGFAGKIFPTLDANESVETANFFTVDVLMGTKRPTFAGTSLTNEPQLGFDLSLIWLGVKIANVLKKADENPGFRPVYPIARLGLAQGEKAVVPKWMRISTDASMAKIGEADFRNELNIAKYHSQGIRLNIDVSDVTGDHEAKEGWRRIGHIQLNESSVSYGCDRQLHFAHPKLKDPQGGN